MSLPEVLQIFGNGREKGGVWFPTQKLGKKCDFQSQFAQFGAYLLPTFYYWKSIINFQQNVGFYYVYSSHLSIILFFYGRAVGNVDYQPIAKPQLDKPKGAHH